MAKSKVLEFLQKGALGLNDEVTSGNGYWFSLKEKDLIDKYLFGDVPQGYNPISESKSVLSKRENPDKTMSLNATPANKTQVLKGGNLPSDILPGESDLEYPDITMVHSHIAPIAKINSAALEEIKLPTSEDLEFPDISLIRVAIENLPKPQVETQQAPVVAIKSPIIEKVEVISTSEPVIYPKDDDLAYPDMTSTGTTSPKVEAKKSGSKDFKNDFENDSGLSLVSIDKNVEKSIEKFDIAEPAQILKPEKNKLLNPNPEEKKLLHERKVKTVSHPILPREEAKSVPREATRSAMPDHLKKRNDNYLMYILVILILIILSLFFYYYRSILNKPFPV